MKTPKLHIYGQVYNHDHAFIVGNKEALVQLRNAITCALEAKSVLVGTCSAVSADGEGYDIKVYQEEEDAYWDKSLLPYTDSDIYIKSEDHIGPWDLFSKYKKKS